MKISLRLKQLGKDSIIYGIGGILSKGIGFFLLPVYTRIFTPAEYGAIEMLVVISGFLGAFLNMGMDSAQSFYFFKERENGHKAQAEIISSILQWKIAWGFIIVFLVTLAAPLLNVWFFNSSFETIYFLVAGASVLFSQIMGQSTEIFRLIYRPWPYIFLSAFQAGCAAIIILLLVLYFEQGVLGYFVGSLVASLIAAIIGCYMTSEYLDFSKIFFKHWPKLIRFGLPLLPAGLTMYVMNTSDRWFIQYYHNMDVLGLYSVAAQFAMLITLAIETFRKAWWPIAMDSMHSIDGKETFRLIARLYVGIGISAIIYLTFLSPWLVKLFTARVYHSSYPLVGILAWYSFFYGFYMIASAGIWKTEKTYYAAPLMFIAALVNILLNIVLIPKYAGMGAAIATSMSFFIWVLITLSVSERLWRVGFSLKKILSQVFLGIITVFILIWMYQEQVGFLYIVAFTHIMVLAIINSMMMREEKKALYAFLLKQAN